MCVICVRSSGRIRPRVVAFKIQMVGSYLSLLLHILTNVVRINKPQPPAHSYLNSKGGYDTVKLVCSVQKPFQPLHTSIAGRLAVHVLTEQARGYYRLEELWKAEPRDLTFYDNAEQYLTLDNIQVPEEVKA